MSKKSIIVALLAACCFGEFVYLFVLASLHGGAYKGEFNGAKTCIHVLQKSADAYSSSNTECAHTWRELLPYLPGGSGVRNGAAGRLPLNPLRSKPGHSDYLFDLPSPVVDELLGGDISSLARFREAGRIAYGASADGKRFAIVAYDSEAHQSAPLCGKYPVLIITNGGALVPVDSK